MKKILFLIMLLAIITGTGCSGNSAQKQPGEEAHDTSAIGTNASEAPAQSAYICPMQCEGSASNEPGKCPVCSMDLVKNPNYKAPASDSASTSVIN